MNLYNIKDNDLVVVKCKDEHGEDMLFNSVYKACYRRYIKDRDGTILGGKLVLMYPSQADDECGVKYYIGNDEFIRMKGQVLEVRESKNLKSIMFTIDHDEDGEIISLGDSIYKAFEDLTTNQHVRLKYYPDPDKNILIDGYYEFNYSTINDTTLYIFTPLIGYEPEEVLVQIDMSDKAFIRDLGITFETMKKEEEILALSVSLPIIQD